MKRMPRKNGKEERFCVVEFLLIGFRPKSKYADWEEPAPDDKPFDFDAVPKLFYFEVEGVGCLEPDAIMQQGIKVLQQKLALVIQDLTEGDGAVNGAETEYGVADMGMTGQDTGYTTPFGTSGFAQNQWPGSTTPYGATPYGQSGGNAWS